MNDYNRLTDEALCWQTDGLVTSRGYQQRKIECNWDKYEETPAAAGVASNDADAGDAAVHTADYQELLKATCVFVYCIHSWYSLGFCKHKKNQFLL